MAQFAKGIQTKEILYHTSRKLFYEKGYADTTVKDIVATAGSKLGTFTYHYDSKESLAVQIYRDFIYRINEHITNKLDHLPDSGTPIAREITEYRAFFKCISQDEHVRRFYIEICDTPSFKSINRLMTKAYILNCIEASKTEPEEDFYPDRDLDINALTSIVSGMEIRYIYDLFLGWLEIRDFDEAVNTFLFYYYGFFMKNRDRLRQLIGLAEEVSDSVCMEIGEGFSVCPAPDQDCLLPLASSSQTAI